MPTFEALALNGLRQWSAERQALKNGRIHKYLARPGRPPRDESHDRHDAALVRCIDFEREFCKRTTDSQTLLLLAYKLPAALADLARVLDKADLL